MVTRYNFFMMEGDVWSQDAGRPASWENSRRVNPKTEFVSYQDYEALRSKATEILREAWAVYQLYNKTQEPDGNLVDMQTLQELADLL